MKGFLKYAALGVAAFVLLGLAVRDVYRAGHDKAVAEGNAALANLEKKHAEELAARWQEYAQKEKEARKALEEQQRKADALSADIAGMEKALETERREHAKKIAFATRNMDCRFGPDFVRLYNEALYGTATISGCLPETGSPGNPQDHTGTASCTGARLHVTPGELLTHAGDYGVWCRSLHGRLEAWIELTKDW